MTVDPIIALESLGYTRREASFLYLVATHSGYFLRRQFDYFIDRVAGAIAQNFIEKARIAGHIEVLDYSRGYRVYHLFAKSIYRLLGSAESQNRRRKGDAAIRCRLIALDYILENDSLRYLESDSERLRFFTETRKISSSVVTDAAGRVHPLLNQSPIALTRPDHPSTSVVQFIFPDEGLLTIEKFRRYLSVLEPLLRAVGNFDIVYASHSSHNFASAQEEFRRRFLASSNSSQRALAQNWRETPRHFAQNNLNFRPEFTTMLFRFSYPQIRRSEMASPSASRPSQLSVRSEGLPSQIDSQRGGLKTG